MLLAAGLRPDPLGSLRAPRPETAANIGYGIGKGGKEGKAERDGRGRKRGKCEGSRKGDFPPPTKGGRRPWYSIQEQLTKNNVRRTTYTVHIRLIKKLSERNFTIEQT